jgi:hypothetical protein
VGAARLERSPPAACRTIAGGRSPPDGRVHRRNARAPAAAPGGAPARALRELRLRGALLRRLCARALRCRGARRQEPAVARRGRSRGLERCLCRRPSRSVSWRCCRGCLGPLGRSQPSFGRRHAVGRGPGAHRAAHRRRRSGRHPAPRSHRRGATARRRTDERLRQPGGYGNVAGQSRPSGGKAEVTGAAAALPSGFITIVSIIITTTTIAGTIASAITLVVSRARLLRRAHLVRRAR